MPLLIDVFSDVVCPWCFIGSDRLDRALEQETDFELVYRPYMLDPSTPETGTDIPAMLREKYGDPSPIFDHVARAAAEGGLKLDLAKQSYAYPTVRAHTLIRKAEARGTQRALVRALFEAYFEGARNISDVEILVAIASQHGFTTDEARALVTNDDELDTTMQLAAGAAQSGIGGVPFTLFDRRLALSGAQSVATIREAIARARTEAAK